MPQVSDSSEIVWWSDVSIPDLTNKMLSRAEQSITLENSSSPDPEGQAVDTELRDNDGISELPQIQL